MADGKKICFGFSKLSKKTNLVSNSRPTQKKIELIDCLESHTIKIKDAVEEIYTPLIIPMPKSNATLIQRKTNTQNHDSTDNRPDSELTPDELAARELIREAQNFVLTGETKKVVTLPLLTNDNEEIKDKDEPTLDDYDKVPISEYGFAMLRGMGWKEGSGIGKTSSIAKVKEPNLRPKGMGLGASLVQKTQGDVNEEQLVLKKGGYAKIVDGKQKGEYCEVQGFDDEAGRVIVKTALKSLVLALNEFLVMPVTKDEYVKSSKVINNAMYEEYKSKAHHSTSQPEPTINPHDKKRINKIQEVKYRSKHKDYHRSSDYASKSKNYKNKCSDNSDSEEEYNRRKTHSKSKHRH